MRILVGSVCRQEPAVLAHHLESLRQQKTTAEISFAFIDDNTDPVSTHLLEDMNPALLEKAGPKDEGSEYEVREDTHKWSLPLFAWLAREKQRILDYAKRERYDAVFLVDSDLVLDPFTLHSLIETQKDVVSAVFWTKWMNDSPPLPQVWLAHPYEFQGMGREAHEFLGDVSGRQLVRVAGLGACTLIRTAVLDRVAYWPLVEGLPSHSMWQGEDRHFCVRAQRNHVELWADAWPDVWHCYRPSQRPELGQRLTELSDRQIVGHPQAGDLVSFTIQPLEEPGLVGHVQHVRGRLGAIKVLPEIENAVSTMEAGQDRLVRLRFPMYHEIAEYRGKVKLVRIKLIGAKPFRYAPTLEDWPLKDRGVSAITEPFMQNVA